MPITGLGALGTLGGSRWDALLLADLAVLVVVAVRTWSPLSVLLAAVLVTLTMAVVWFCDLVVEACGTSGAASTTKGVGAGLLALAIGAWGVRGRSRALWALPAGLVAAGIWIAVVASVWPGGSGHCLD